MVDVEKFVRLNPLASQLLDTAEVLDCLRRGGNLKLEHRQVGVIPTVVPSCEFPEQENPNAPFFRNPTDEHNPSRPNRDPSGEKEIEDTEDPPPQPSPRPLPRPTLPPVVIVREVDRRVIPVPPQRQPPTIPPSIPLRRIPSLEAPEDVNTLEVTEKRWLTINQSAAERTYGCMIHSPITESPAIFRICRRDQSPDDQGVVESAKKFIDYLAREIAGTAAETAITGGCVLAVNILPTRFLRYVPGGKLAYAFGCQFLGNVAADFLFESNNALQSIDGQGHINVKYIECTPESGGNEGDDGTIGLEPSKPEDLNECFVPIRNFRTNEPEQLGMRCQLQIIYQLIEDGQKFQKAISLPSPREGIEEEDVKAVFPLEFPFGEIKSEVDIIPYGYIRVYTETEEFADNFFDQVIPALISGQEKEGTRRHSHRPRGFKQGNFRLYKAIYFTWLDESGTPPIETTIFID